MFQIRGYAVLSLVLRDLASKSVLSLSTLAACREAVYCVTRIKPLLIRGVRFLICDRRLWCSAPWVVKMQVRLVAFYRILGGGFAVRVLKKRQDLAVSKCRCLLHIVKWCRLLVERGLCAP